MCFIKELTDGETVRFFRQTITVLFQVFGESGLKHKSS